MIYPFIVNNPGEAAQAKRRIGAATIGHLTPPLIAAGSHGAALELEGLFDEFVQAQGLDPRRARAIAALILERGQATGLLKECAAEGKPPEEALIALDGWLCDLKDMRIGDGLHVFGRSPENADGFASGLELDAEAAETLRDRVAACGAGESLGLIRALAGRFVEPGPAGAPARGRLDVLPTGRNLFAIDPRSAPTRNAWEIGRRAAGGSARTLRAGPWGLAEADRARSLGFGDHAHRRRRPGAGLRAHRLPADLGPVVQPRQRLRDSPPCHAGAAARRCHFADLGPLPRCLSEPDRTLQRRGAFRRRARRKRGRQSARRFQGRDAGPGVRRGAGRLWRRARTAYL